MTSTTLYFRCIRYGIRAVLFLCPLLCFAPPSAKADTIPTYGTSQQTDNADSTSVRGYFSAKYISRMTTTAGTTFRDEDLFSDLRLDVAKPQSSPYELHFYGTLWDALTNNRNAQGFSPFEDIHDTYSSRVHGYLYEFHVDINQPLSGITQVRIGRQDGNREEPVFFDGLAMDFKVARTVNMTLYGGAAINYYEIDSQWGDDWLGGAGLDFFPWSGTSLITDYIYVADKRTQPETTNQYDNLASFKLVQRLFSPSWKATAKFRLFNGDDRDLKLRIIGTIPEWDFELQAAYLRQFRTQYEQSNQFSPFFDVLGPYYPYESYDFKLRKMFGLHYAVDLGYFQRSLLDTHQENAFNHSFRRTYAVFDLIDIFTERLTLSFIGEQWKSGTQQYENAGFDAAYAFKQGRRSPKISAGTYYSLYKYDYYVMLGERTKVRTYYGKIDLPFAQRYSFNGSYEFEHGLEDYQTVKVGMRYDF